MKTVFINLQSNAIVLVGTKYEMEYINNHNYLELFSGLKKECLSFIENYWEENFIETDDRKIIHD